MPPDRPPRLPPPRFSDLVPPTICLTVGVERAVLGGTFAPAFFAVALAVVTAAGLRARPGRRADPSVQRQALRGNLPKLAPTASPDAIFECATECSWTVFSSYLISAAARELTGCLFSSRNGIRPRRY